MTHKIKSYMFSFHLLLFFFFFGNSNYCHAITFELELANCHIIKIFELEEDQGYSAFGNRGNDLTRLNIDIYGEIISEETFSTPNKSYHPSSIIQLEDKSYISYGFVKNNNYTEYNSDLFISKYTSEGEVEWVKFINNNNVDFSGDIISYDDYFLISSTCGDSLFQDSDVTVNKLSISGDSLWTRIYDSAYNDIGAYLCKANNGNFLIGATRGKEQSGDYYGELLKVNAAGDTLLTRRTDSLAIVFFNDIIKTDDDNYMITGSYGVSPDGDYVLLQKFDIDFNDIWVEHLANGIDYYNRGYIISKLQSSSGYVLGCSFDFNPFIGETMDAGIIKVDEIGNQLWTRKFPLAGAYTSSGFVAQTLDDGYIMTRISNSAQQHTKILKLDENGYVDIEENNYELAITNYELKQNYPNPFNPTTRINYELGSKFTTRGFNNYELAKIVIYNAMGQEVWVSNPLSLNTNHCLFDGSKYNSGIYYYSLIIDGKKVDTQSMILLK